MFPFFRVFSPLLKHHHPSNRLWNGFWRKGRKYSELYFLCFRCSKFVLFSECCGGLCAVWKTLEKHWGSMLQCCVIVSTPVNFAIALNTATENHKISLMLHEGLTKDKTSECFHAFSNSNRGVILSVRNDFWRFPWWNGVFCVVQFMVKGKKLFLFCFKIFFFC